MSIEIFYRPNNTLTIKAEARDVQEMFKTLGPIQEILGACKCGKCGGEKIRFLYRKTATGNHDVYELLCDTPVEGREFNCGHKLMLGETSDHVLFPRRYAQVQEGEKWVPQLDGDGKKVFLPNNGWVRWDSKTKKYV